LSDESSRILNSLGRCPFDKLLPLTALHTALACSGWRSVCLRCWS